MPAVTPQGGSQARLTAPPLWSPTGPHWAPGALETAGPFRSPTSPRITPLLSAWLSAALGSGPPRGLSSPDTAPASAPWRRSPGQEAPASPLQRHLQAPPRVLQELRGRKARAPVHPGRLAPHGLMGAPCRCGCPACPLQEPSFLPPPCPGAPGTVWGRPQGCTSWEARGSALQRRCLLL